MASSTPQPAPPNPKSRFERTLAIYLDPPAFITSAKDKPEEEMTMDIDKSEERKRKAEATTEGPPPKKAKTAPSKPKKPAPAWKLYSQEARTEVCHDSV